MLSRDIAHNFFAPVSAPVCPSGISVFFFFKKNRSLQSKNQLISFPFVTFMHGFRSTSVLVASLSPKPMYILGLRTVRFGQTLLL